MGQVRYTIEVNFFLISYMQQTNLCGNMLPSKVTGKKQLKNMHFSACEPKK